MATTNRPKPGERGNLVSWEKRYEGGEKGGALVTFATMTDIYECVSNGKKKKKKTGGWEDLRGQKSEYLARY